MGRAISLSPQPLTAVLASLCPQWNPRETTWLPRVDGIEVEVAIWSVGGEGKTHRDQNVFLLLFYFFCTKANCTCFIFLREDCRQLEIAAFYLPISEELEGWGKQ